MDNEWNSNAVFNVSTLLCFSFPLFRFLFFLPYKWKQKDICLCFSSQHGEEKILTALQKSFPTQSLSTYMYLFQPFSELCSSFFDKCWMFVLWVDWLCLLLLLISYYIFMIYFYVFAKYKALERLHLNHRHMCDVRKEAKLTSQLVTFWH